MTVGHMGDADPRGGSKNELGQYLKYSLIAYFFLILGPIRKKAWKLPVSIYIRVIFSQESQTKMFIHSDF